MTNATASLFTSTTVDELDAEIDALVEQILATRRNLCPECGSPRLDSRPFVDVTPGAIPADDPAGHDRVVAFIAQAPAHLFGHGQVRIPAPDLGHAITTAAHLRALGTPAHAIHLGGY